MCPDRPGLGTPACTVDSGHLVAEVGIADWILEKHGSDRTDTLVFSDLLLRYGLSVNTEVQIGWEGLEVTREQDSAAVDHSTGSGDLTLALRHNFAKPDGSGLSIAVMPLVRIPTHVSSDGWGAGLILPLSYELGPGVQIALTAEALLAPDQVGRGHHAAYSGTLGVDVPLTDMLDATFELQAEKDDDPQDHERQLLAAASLALAVGSSLQLDAGANFGLDRDAPDVEVYAGVARRF